MQMDERKTHGNLFILFKQFLDEKKITIPLSFKNKIYITLYFCHLIGQNAM
jgi:hypothetical protein